MKKTSLIVRLDNYNTDDLVNCNEKVYYFEHCHQNINLF